MKIGCVTREAQLPSGVTRETNFIARWIGCGGVVEVVFMVVQLRGGEGGREEGG